jgi:Protein of unknown function (DUF1266)
MGLFSNLFGSSKSIRLNKNEALDGIALKEVLVSSIYAEQQGAYINSYNTGIDPTKRKQILEDWWSIYDSTTAWDKLNYLLQEGYSKIFPAVYEAFEDNTENYAAILQKGVQESDIEKAEGILINLHANYGQLIEDKVINKNIDIKKYGIAGWDYGRGSFIARLCYEAGYMNLDQLKKYLKDCLAALKMNCPNWEAYAKSYIIGRAMWNGTDNSGMVVIANDLLNNSKSPLLSNPL